MISHRSFTAFRPAPGMVLSVLFTGLMAVPAVATPFMKGEAYDQGRKTKLFNLALDKTEEGDITHYTAIYSDLEGKALIEEHTRLKGIQVVKIETDQKQTGAKAVIEFDGKIAKFSKTVDGKTETSEETVKGDFVAPGNFQLYIASKWKELSAGKNVAFRYAVWDRMETVGFQLKKTKDEGEATWLLLNPSSFIIRALVSPIELKFMDGGNKMVLLKGRLQPKIKDGSKWKDVDGEMDYTYLAEAPAAAAEPAPAAPPPAAEEKKKKTKK